MSGSIPLQRAHILTRAGTLRRQPDPILWQRAISGTYDWDGSGILRVNLAALIPCLTLFPPRLAGPASHARFSRLPFPKKSRFIYRCGRRLDIERNASPAAPATQLDPQTPAHIPPTPPEGLLLQRRLPPPPPNHPTHSLAPSLQCAKFWHAV